ncbi:hypothetical protein [Bacillus cereus]|uniref:DUF5626 domain-containing protein n=1 Tax=Bacillus cereus TaxID=1396 RepID=A0A9X7BFM5_BACCE|nr:hypothetical protein [Bacillus cereus]PED41976.1 hypothetical protein CON26_20940 [Bacillus cereus]PFV11207.1 hypothetical protein COK98_02755 [Bacillus cereus]
MKRFILSTFFAVFSLFVVTPAFASELDDLKLEELNNTGEIIYQDDEITVTSFGDSEKTAEAILNHPASVSMYENNPITYASVNGPGGRSSIIASNSGRSVYWSVKPATKWPYQFNGVVKLRYHSGFKRDVVVGGMGALGSTLSGMVTMNKNNGGYATLTGTAYSLDGKYYKVMPGVTDSFRPN